MVTRSHDLGLAVLPWTVNTTEEMRAMAALGVDGLATDYPDVALALMAATSDEGSGR